MGFDFIRSKKDGFYFNNLTWTDVFRIAVGFGWEPTGTGPPRGSSAKDWPRSYFGNDGQLFYARDAKRLANVLEMVITGKGIEDIAVNPARKVARWEKTSEGKRARDVVKYTKYLAAKLGGGVVLGEKRKVGKSVAEKPWVLEDDGKATLHAFIKFCRHGSFRIW